VQLEKEEIEHLLQKLPKLKAAIAQKVVGQSEVIDQLIIGLLASGHVLLEGVPGLAKTLMIRTLAEAISISFSRIQFTPDLMPSDILGTEILQEDESGRKFFKFTQGPVFSNVLLADEINRTPPKTQSALLELMQEYAVTYAGKRYELPKPFFLLATQNPVEQSGTFPLPEAQVDRFLLHVEVGYPTEAEEEEILKLTTGSSSQEVSSVISGEELQTLQQLCRDVHIAPALITQVNKAVRNTRPQTSNNLLVRQYVDWGAGPRAGQALILAAKGHALLQGRYAVTPPDIKAVAQPCLRHRLILNYQAQGEGVTSANIIEELF